MNTTKPYFRAFAVGAVWLCALTGKMVSRGPDRWRTSVYLTIFVIAWVVTALLLGVAATRVQRLRSWWGITLGTIVGWFLVLGVLGVTARLDNRPLAPPKFKNTGEMMAYFAAATTKWVKHDRGIDLDYSLDSVRIVEEQLDRISREVDKANPKRGTFGIAMGYGAFIGEVFRRRNGGVWGEDDPAGGARSFPLTTITNGVIFPVGWCWKRLTNGEEDNVYHKAMTFADFQNLKAGLTNTAAVLLQVITNH